MSDESHQIRHVLTSPHERKELLALACEVDRASWNQACRPNRSPGARLAGKVFSFLDTFSSLLPGRLGRMVRGASFLANLGRQLGWLRF